MQERYEKPWVGFVLGDQAGIGPEIVLKFLKRPHVYEQCRPLIIGNYELLCHTARQIAADYLLTPYTLEELKRRFPGNIQGSGVPVVDIEDDISHVVVGTVNTAAGLIAYHSIEADYQLLRTGILVAGINPCLEDGILETEEKDIILPAVMELRKEIRDMDISGPIPADRIFDTALEEDYNGILYMYHDQGDIAMKTRMFQTTACIYTNVPYPILSPGHGSVLDIAELGVANPTNISYVLSTLTDIIQTRRQLNAALQQA